MLSYFSQTNTIPETNDMVVIEDEETKGEDKEILIDKTDMEIKVSETPSLEEQIREKIYDESKTNEENIKSLTGLCEMLLQEVIHINGEISPEKSNTTEQGNNLDQDETKEEETKEEETKEEETTKNIYHDNTNIDIFQFIDDISSTKNTNKSNLHVFSYIVKVKLFINSEEYTQKFVCEDRKLISNIKLNIFNRVKADRAYDTSYFKNKYDEYYFVIEEKSQSDTFNITTLYGRYYTLFGAFMLQDKLCQISIEEVNSAQNYNTRVMDLRVD